jgi:AcrR family transcriptional regulator
MFIPFLEKYIMKDSDKPDAVIDAALELIAEHGFHGVSMAMIAEKANVGMGTIYRYFSSKDILISEMYKVVEERIKAALLNGYSKEKPVRERFFHLVSTLIKYLIKHPLEFRYMEQYHNSPYGVAFRKNLILNNHEGELDIFKELFLEGIRQNVVKNLPILMLFSLGLGPLVSLTRDHIFSLLLLDDELICKAVEACWDGVRR